MKPDWQWAACFVLLIGAIYYVYRTVRKSGTREHNCPECGVPLKNGKMKHSGGS